MEPQPTTTRKKVIFSGIQPTGRLMLGNYIGAIRNWKILEEEYDCLYSVVDMHAITIRQDPADFRRRSMDALALLIAVGLDPDKSLIYLQSHVPQHAELSWVLSCFTYMGELSRMTQFKDKAEKHQDNVNAGLFSYPVLMAADILLYSADLVPVGADQKQHMELARDIAQRFNAVYDDVFTVPEPYIPQSGARIMSLQDPLRKMSKSDPDDTFIALLDDEATIRRKFKRAVTDSETSICYDPEKKPGVSNLLTIIASLTGESMDDVIARLSGKGYGALKDAAAAATIEALTPIQQEFRRVSADKAYLAGVAAKNAERASRIASRMLAKVHKKIGFAPRG